MTKAEMTKEEATSETICCSCGKCSVFREKPVLNTIILLEMQAPLPTPVWIALTTHLWLVINDPSSPAAEICFSERETEFQKCKPV